MANSNVTQVRQVRRKSHHGQMEKGIRLQLAIEAWEEGMGAISYRKIAREFNVCRATMHARMAGRRSMEQLHQDQQLLTPDEESTMLDSIERMHSWRWHYRVSQVIHLATEVLMKRTLTPPYIGVNWVSRFLDRHPSLHSRFSTPKDRERIVAEDAGVFQKWFDLFIGQVGKYKIKPRNIYSMDEKGYALGMIGKARVIVSKHERVAYMM